jgi:hypothetical protein
MDSIHPDFFALCLECGVRVPHPPWMRMEGAHPEPESEA